MRTEIPTQADLDGPQWAIEAVNRDEIKPGDAVWTHLYDRGWGWRTVSPRDIKYNSFMGRTIRGDSYALGARPVYRLRYIRPA